MNHIKIAHALPLAVAFGGLFLAPALARADVLDCYEPLVTITEPADGATLEGVTELAVTFTVEAQGADSELLRVYVLVDDIEAATLDTMTSGEQELTVMVTAGEHQIVAGAFDDCSGDGLSAPITIEITPPAGASTGEPDTAGEETGTGGDDATGGGDGGTADEDGGCAVARTPKRSWVGLSAFLLMVIGAWRLRRSEP